MYKVTIYDGPNDKTGIVIQSPYINSLKLSSGKVKQVTQGIPNFTFSINPSNPGWGKLKMLTTLIRVINLKTGQEEFAGRVLKPTQVMKNDGMFTVQYECEGFLAYLQDSSQRHGEYHNMTIREFLQVMINNHNRQVEPHKRMKLGTVTVTNSTDNVYRYLGYDKTYESIKDKLIDRLGGYIKLREETDGFYLDYLESVGEVKRTPIKLRHNLKDMQKEIDPTDVITRVIPLGANIESEDETATDVSQARVTIAEVNNGKDYLDDLDMQKEFGIIEGSITFDDITNLQILKTRGEQFIASQKAARISYTVTPLDLFLIDIDMDSFEIDNYYPIINPVFTIDELLQVIEKDIDLLHPENMSLTIGEQYRTLSDYQINANKQSRILRDLESKTIGQSKRIGTLSIELQTTKKALEETQENMNNFEGSTTEGMAAITEAILTIDDAINNLNEIVLGLQDIITVEEKQQMQEAIAKNASDILAMNEQINDLTNRINKLEEGGGGNG